MRWQRMTMRDTQGAPYTSYYSEDRDWAAWSIDQVRVKSRSQWQPMYRGFPTGPRHLRLRDAKGFVEREGRPVPAEPEPAETPERHPDAYAYGESWGPDNPAPGSSWRLTGRGSEQ